MKSYRHRWFLRRISYTHDGELYFLEGERWYGRGGGLLLGAHRERSLVTNLEEAAFWVVVFAPIWAMPFGLLGAAASVEVSRGAGGGAGCRAGRGGPGSHVAESAVPETRPVRLTSSSSPAGWRLAQPRFEDVASHAGDRVCLVHLDLATAGHGQVRVDLGQLHGGVEAVGLDDRVAGDLPAAR
jgi:hypothetical protein